MNHLLEDDEDLNPRPERELTLSTGAILGIFLGLILICGLFFGFGYNLGQKSKTASATPADTATTDAAGSTTVAGSGRPKPSAGSYTTEVPVKAQPATVVAAAQPPAASSRQTALETATASSSPAEPAPAPVTRATPPPPAAPMPSTSATGTFIVQIAAVTRQDDANMLVKALHGRGYSVAARNEPGDQLIHIQVGPFNTKAEANAMRERLLSDGYNAIVK